MGVRIAGMAVQDDAVSILAILCQAGHAAVPMSDTPAQPCTSDLTQLDQIRSSQETVKVWPTSFMNAAPRAPGAPRHLSTGECPLCND